MRFRMPAVICCSSTLSCLPSWVMERLMCRPLPLSWAKGLGMNEANSPLRSAMVFTTDLKVMKLSAASNGEPYLKSISCWPGPDSWWLRSV